MSAAKIGADIESICGKCGDVWHVLVAKVGEKIVQVQCKQCGAVHRYRPPEKVKSARTPRSISDAPPRASKAPRSHARKEDAPLVAFDASKVGRRYRPVETFAVGDVIEHATFGRGVVEVALEPGKIQVWFEGRDLQPSERRTLVHARAATATSTAPALPERKHEAAGPAEGDEE
jgi:hypothetical protein